MHGTPQEKVEEKNFYGCTMCPFVGKKLGSLLYHQVSGTISSRLANE